MNELIKRLQEIKYLSELENFDSINKNVLIYVICKSNRYDLLKNSNIRLDITDIETLEKLTDFLLSNVDSLYYMHQNGYSFSKEELNSIFNIVLKKYEFSYQFERFLEFFFKNNDQLNNFIKDHELIFKDYIEKEKKSVAYCLNDCDHFVELVLKGGHAEALRELEKYSVSNLKLLAQFSKENGMIPYYLANERFAVRLFSLKSNLEPNEFCELLNLFKEKISYDKKIGDEDITFFSLLIKDNIDYLIEVVSETKIVPKCLIESATFRDECIKRNRIDLAVKCILSYDIMKNETLINAYSKELNISINDFYERSKWILNYYQKNNNIFNTFLATSLKNNIFNFNKEHLERFINDVEIQISISKLNDAELMILSKILDIYDYKDYDISSLIINVIKNIHNYQELINSINIENISNQELRSLVAVLQLPNNPYQINRLDSLKRYAYLKSQFFENNYEANDLLSNKGNLLKALFNIDLKEAKYIDFKYCHDDNDNNILDNLKNSELPESIYNYLTIINKIIECDNLNELIILYNNFKNNKVYESEIPFEAYLRANYTELYSKSLYKINERKEVYGPKDSILSEINYNGKNIQICIPRANFNFLGHCLGYCSLSSDTIDKNYKNDWLDRPQLQDHFVACSYINERGLYSIISQSKIIYGFETLDNGSILGMGNTDIDSIGTYSRSYNGSRQVQEGNGSRARYFVPSEILKTINDNGHNEIVIERRNTNRSKSGELKRKPDYIIMMAESLERENFNNLETLYKNQLSFFSLEDKKELEQIQDSSKIKQILTKYNDKISEIADFEGVSSDDIVNSYVNLILKAKYYEECLKASSEFDIPLVIVDKTYYFNKMLKEANIYDDETKDSILTYYSKCDYFKKKRIFNMVAKGEDVSNLINSKNKQY